ncbi:hypothetical protein LCGC14_0665250 [marine sediment metagenome]|uniref:Uncharacterized protein n=1 Tax=marine sediment metagenome TaxID=412755 RepID=A0A0F9QXH5_9ZZZZ
MKEQGQVPGRTANEIDLERQLAEVQRCDDCADSPEDIRLPAGYRCYFCDKRFCGPHAKMHFKDGATTATALAEAQARLRKANCAYGDGWISDDLECGVDVEPWCGKHAVLYHIKANKEAQGKLDAVETWRKQPRGKGGMAELDRILCGTKEDE